MRKLLRAVKRDTAPAVKTILLRSGACGAHRPALRVALRVNMVNDYWSLAAQRTASVAVAAR